MHRLHAGVRHERPPPRGRFIQNATKGEDVGAVVHRFGLDLLGGHVADGPDDGALPGPGLGRGGSVRGLLIRDVPFREFGQPEVQHLRKAVLGDHDVPGLQVPVDDPGRVGFGQPLGRLGEIAEQRPKVGLLVMNFRGQRFPADQLHRK